MGGASTRSCRPASSRSPACCRATRRSPDQAGDREDLRQARREVVRQNFAAVDATLAHLHEVKVPVPSPVNGTPRPPVAETAPEFVQRVTAVDDRRARATDCRSAPSRWTAPGRPARRSGRSATSRSRSRSGTRPLHPVQQVRAGLPARGHPRQGLRARGARRARRPTFKAPTFKAPEVKDTRTRSRSPRGLHRLRALRRGLPGQGQDRGATRRST